MHRTIGRIRQHGLYSVRQIALIRESGKILSKCLTAIREAAVPGVTTNGLNDIAGRIIASHKAKSPFLGYVLPNKPPFPAHICTSVNDVVVHGAPDDVMLKDGDIVSIDIGVSKDGYIADSAWTFPIGQVSAPAKMLLEACEKALEAGLAAAKPRGKVGDISKAVQAFAEANGLGIVTEFVGHGVGHFLHEDPQVPNKSDPQTDWVTLKPGTVIAVEPMLSIGSGEVIQFPGSWPVKTKDGSLTAHFEHTIAVTENGIEVLTAP